MFPDCEFLEKSLRGESHILIEVIAYAQPFRPAAPYFKHLWRMLVLSHPHGFNCAGTPSSPFDTSYPRQTSYNLLVFPASSTV